MYIYSRLKRKMNQWCFLLIVLNLYFTIVDCAEGGVTLRQERARITYVNPKYIRDGEVFTGRRNRNEPYLTNMTGTLLGAFNNNVSCGGELVLTTGNDFNLVYKVCEGLKLKWVADYIRTYSDIPIKCPVPADTYHLFNMQLPPKQFPFVIKSDSDFNIVCFQTETREKLFVATVGLRKDNKKRNG